MPDLLTHLAAARIPGVLVRDRRLQALLIIGTFLPDLVGKGYYWVLQNRDGVHGMSHSILGILLTSYLACLLLEDRLRRPGFFVLALGGAVHVLVDLIKDNLGTGGAMPFLPFSTRGVEFGWMDPEDVVFLIPVDAAILAALWLFERRRARVQQ